MSGMGQFGAAVSAMKCEIGDKSPKCKSSHCRRLGSA